ncbi:MAG: TraX family protein [Candidatus Izemoplasmatales bacterium]
MNRLYLKLIAALTMVIDHVAYIFLEHNSDLYLAFRMVGRISFVLFAFMIAEGFRNTKDIRKYLLRLGLAALILEVFIVIYYFVTDINMIISFNILWTLFVGLLSLYLFFHKNIYLKILVIPLVIASELIGFSYGAYGVLMILFFGVYRNKVTNLLHLIFLNLLFIEKPLLSYLNLEEMSALSVNQWFSVVAIIFIFVYNGNPGRYKMRWFFYIFYPGHLIVLYLIDLLI